MIAASRAHVIEPELEGPPEMIARFATGVRRTITLMLFVYSGLAIFSAAEPFAEGLLASGRTLGIEEFILVQWLAPLASESPEFVVATLFVLRGNPQASIGTLVSSTVNQWTLLVGMLPLAYSLSSGQVASMHMDARQVAEVLLTSAQSVFALVVIASFTFSLTEALVLLALFISQLFFPSPEIRYLYAVAYIVLALGLAFMNRRNRVSLLSSVPRWLRRPLRRRASSAEKRRPPHRAAG